MDGLTGEMLTSVTCVIACTGQRFCSKTADFSQPIPSFIRGKIHGVFSKLARMAQFVEQIKLDFLDIDHPLPLMR